MNTLQAIMFPQLQGRPWTYVNLNDYVLRFAPEIANAPENPLLNSQNQIDFLERVTCELDAGYTYGGYLEDRSALWRGHYMNPNAMTHLGVDYNVPAKTPVKMPFDGKVVLATHDKDQNGGWGGRIDFYNEEKDFYFILGHLDGLAAILTVGSVLQRGTVAGFVGTANDNGGFFQHMHLQVMTKPEYESFTDPMKIDGYGKMTPDLWQRYPDPEYVNELF